MDILLVDDDEQKIGRITELVNQLLEKGTYSFQVARNAHSAVQALRSKRFGLVLLDLNLPMREGDSPKGNAGLEILRSIRERRLVHRPNHIIGLSAFDGLIARHKDEFSAEMWFLLQYDVSSNEWAERLGRKLLYLVESELPPVAGHFETTLGIVTALHPIELESILSLSSDWKRTNVPGDDTFYHVTEWVSGAKCLRVVAAACAEMGMPAATALSMKLISNFRPRFLAITGIAAGVKGNFGDILIADQSWDYGSGKSGRGKDGRSRFMPAPSALPISPYLKSRFQLFNMNSSVLREIEAGWKRKDQAHPPLQVHLGPVASGASVVEDPAIIDGILNLNRKVIGIEMETYGVFLAAAQCSEPRPLAMSVKSICDFGDPTKSDAYQAYAAYTSASYLYRFALQELTDD